MIKWREINVAVEVTRFINVEMTESIRSAKPTSSSGVDLTTGSIPRHLVHFAFPMLMGNAIQSAYNIINSVWVGNGLGTDALAALTVGFPVFFLVMAVSGGISVAASILVSQAFGAHDIPRMHQIIRNSVFLTALVALVFTLMGHSFLDVLLKIMRTPADIFPAALSYLHVFLWTTPFMFGLYLITSVLRGVGDSHTPLKFQAAALGLATILDPILMFGWFGFPKLGLNGTAVAAVIAQAGALAALIYYLRRKNHVATPRWQGFRPDLSICMLTLKIGVPSMLQQGLISIGMVVLLSLVNGFGKNAAAAFGAAMRIDQFAFLPVMSVGMAVSSLAGQNIGAHRFDRVHQIFKWGIALSCGMTLLATILALGAPGVILRMFVQDQDVIRIGVNYLRIVGSGYLLFSVMFVSNGVINGSGHTFFTTIVSLVAQWIVRLPLATWLSSSMNKIEGIWIAMIVGYAVGVILSLSYYFSGRWRKALDEKSEPV